MQSRQSRLEQRTADSSSRSTGRQQVPPATINNSSSAQSHRADRGYLFRCCYCCCCCCCRPLHVESVRSLCLCFQVRLHVRATLHWESLFFFGAGAAAEVASTAAPGPSVLIPVSNSVLLCRTIDCFDGEMGSIFPAGSQDETQSVLQRCG